MKATGIARNATRSMRIVALPLAPHRKVNGKPVEHLTYYHFVTPPDTKHANSWSKWAVAKASGLWAGLGKADEGTWKRRAFVYGERLIDRLEFEELALKSLDPQLGPKLSDIVSHGSQAEKAPLIPLVYPPSVCASPMPHLHSLLQKRTPRHRKGFWFWLAVSPLTAPFMIIPIIPNFPFFFCVWRSWSHYRAYKASQYLDGLLQQGAIVPEVSTQLDTVYARYAPRKAPPVDTEPETSLPSSHGNASTQHPSAEYSSAQHPSAEDASKAALLLTKDAVPALSEALALPADSTFMADMYRALEQARLRLEGSKESKK